MSHSINKTAYHTLSATEFNRRIEDGLRRAPEERSKALKDIWAWFTHA